MHDEEAHDDRALILLHPEPELAVGCRRQQHVTLLAPLAWAEALTGQPRRLEVEHRCLAGRITVVARRNLYIDVGIDMCVDECFR